jgi:hypothetical protein
MIWNKLTLLDGLLLRRWPDRWLTETGRRAKHGLREARHYRDLILSALDSLNLSTREPDQPGRVGQTRRVQLGFAGLDVDQGAYCWRIDGFSPGVRGSRFLTPQTPHNLSLGCGAPVATRQHDGRIWIEVNMDDPPAPVSPGRLGLVAFSDMQWPDEAGLWLPVGMDENRRQVWHDLASTGYPHFLIGGATGAGKSNLLNCWLVSLAARHTPQEVRFYLVDLKRVELAAYARCRTRSAP